MLASAPEEFEPIVERGAGRSELLPPPGSPEQTSQGRPPPLPPSHCRTPPTPPHLRPARGTSGAAQLTMDYCRQRGSRPSWKPGDVAFRLGQACEVIRVVANEQPPYVAVRTPRGSEIDTELCLLSERPPSRPHSRLSPIQDLSERPQVSGGKARHLSPIQDLLERPRASVGKAIPYGRSSSVPVRGLSPSAKLSPPAKLQLVSREGHRIPSK